MPPIDAPHLIAYLFDAGPVVDGAMGQAPLRAGDLIDWQRETGIRLHPWQAAFIRHLSREYLAQLQRSDKADCPAPFGAAERRILTAKKIDEVFG